MAVHAAPKPPRPRKVALDALQRCSAGLSADALATLVYGSNGPSELRAVYSLIWNLRRDFRIASTGSGFSTGVYRWEGAR